MRRRTTSNGAQFPQVAPTTGTKIVNRNDDKPGTSNPRKPKRRGVTILGANDSKREPGEGVKIVSRTEKP